MSAAPSAERDLNAVCSCITLDRSQLKTILDHNLGDPALATELLSATPNLFSDRPMFLPRAEVRAMQAVVEVIVEVTSTPAFLLAVMAHAPDIARPDHGPTGAFLGFDFHIAPDGPKLIEINTNAGGGFLNAALADAQRSCCHATRPDLLLTPDNFEQKVVKMFRSEWRLQRSVGEPKTIAIVDENPASQFLFPEFLIAQELFRRRGIEAVICDPGDFEFDGAALKVNGRTVDLVYNRLVDFSFEAPRSAALRQAYVSGATVVTPNPRNHAVFADKRNLVLLSDEGTLRKMGLTDPEVRILTRSIPKTVIVDSANAEELWRERRRYFFKPVAGHGSKAVYRGDKLTKAVWDQILKNDYVAQGLVPPSTRTVFIDGTPVERKVDVRLYTYGSEVLAVAARLYQGQTTNMRTPGGGFAPVFVVEAANASRRTEDSNCRE